MLHYFFGWKCQKRPSDSKHVTVCYGPGTKEDRRDNLQCKKYVVSVDHFYIWLPLWDTGRFKNVLFLVYSNQSLKGNFLYSLAQRSFFKDLQNCQNLGETLKKVVVLGSNRGTFWFCFHSIQKPLKHVKAIFNCVICRAPF